jgi:actin-related protein 6
MESERFAVPEVLFTPSDVGIMQAGIVEATAASIHAVEPYMQASVNAAPPPINP